MAHYAFTRNNLVVQVIVGHDENHVVEGIDSWENYYAEVTGLDCFQTSYNTRGGVHYNPETGEPSADQTKALRVNYAGVGFTYDEERDAFVPPKPFESWVLNEETCLWEAPLPYPDGGGSYSWNEDLSAWELIPSE